MGMDIRGSILLNSGSFAPKFWEKINCSFNALWCKNLKFEQNGVTWLMIWTEEYVLSLLFFIIYLFYLLL